MRSPTHLSLRFAACLSALFLLAGCSSSDARARQALGEYQSATAANDPAQERRALLKLVQAKDDVPDYWAELGKLDASIGNYGDAYYAFSRAYELDRANVDVLRSVTQLALRTGDLPSALKHADELEVIAPGDPWSKLAKGWAAIGELRFDEAIAAADGILSASPYDPSATVLKARGLIGLNRMGDAEQLLTKQVQGQPSDVASLQFLARIYEREGNWQRLLPISERIGQLTPNDPTYSLLAIKAALRSGNDTVGRAISLRVLTPNASPALVASTLALWEDDWNSPQRIDDARNLGFRAQNPQSRLVYASFLSRLGQPADAARLSSQAATLPVNAANADANAVLADAWARMGNVGPAKVRFDAVLAFDSGNATALRGRATLELRLRNPQAAIVDAQKLTSVLPNSAPDRLLLASSYAAAGNKAWFERTLWSAFQDIPADERLLAALEATKRNDPDATRQLQEEFDHQRDAKLSRGLV